MKVFAISDLHLSINNPKPMNIFGHSWDNYLQEIEKNWNEVVSDNDIVLIPGDISWAMKLTDAVADLEYINKHKGKKIILRGNHDYWWNSFSALNAILPKGMYAIQNNAIKIGNYIFCGTRGWTVPYEEGQHKTADDERIYKREVIRLQLSLEEAKKLKTENETIVALMHYPPFNVKAQPSEFTELLERYGVQKVVYGHLHNLDFVNQIFLQKNGIDYHLTSCNVVANKMTLIAS